MVEKNFLDLVTIMRKLRTECPWDMKQTHDSIKAATLEEAYEVVHAIDDKDNEELKKELGDLLLHVVFHSAIAEDNGAFRIDDVITSIKEKLIRRHPHIFGDVKVANDNDIMQNWEAIKFQEGRTSVIEGLPKAMSALLRAFRIQEKAAKAGFDWEHKADVWKKVVEETNELHEAEEIGNHEKIEEELGDLFFALTNYSRFLNINPENALRRTIEKFEKRFRYIEARLAEQNKTVFDSNLEEMDKYWNESKSKR